jgi:hypothetical protein
LLVQSIGIQNFVTSKASPTYEDLPWTLFTTTKIGKLKKHFTDKKKMIARIGRVGKHFSYKLGNTKKTRISEIHCLY